MLETVQHLTSLIEMLKSDIAMFGPAGDDLSRLAEYEARRAALIREAQEKTTNLSGAANG